MRRDNLPWPAPTSTTTTLKGGCGDADVVRALAFWVVCKIISTYNLATKALELISLQIQAMSLEKGVG